jgi:hypothetical protein
VRDLQKMEVWLRILIESYHQKTTLFSLDIRFSSAKVSSSRLKIPLPVVMLNEKKASSNYLYSLKSSTINYLPLPSYLLQGTAGQNAEHVLEVYE